RYDRSRVRLAEWRSCPGLSSSRFSSSCLESPDTFKVPLELLDEPPHDFRGGGDVADQSTRLPRLHLALFHVPFEDSPSGVRTAVYLLQLLPRGAGSLRLADPLHPRILDRANWRDAFCK